MKRLILKIFIHTPNKHSVNTFYLLAPVRKVMRQVLCSRSSGSVSSWPLIPPPCGRVPQGHLLWILHHPLWKAHKGPQSLQLPPSKLKSPIPSKHLHFFCTYTQTFREEEEKTTCALTYFFSKMYLGPGLLSESVSIHKQVVDIVGWKAVGAGVHLIKPGEQQRELRRRFQTDEAGIFDSACFRTHF